MRSALIVLIAAAPPPPDTSTVIGMADSTLSCALLVATCAALAGSRAVCALSSRELRKLIPQPIAEGAALGALGEDAVLLERAPEHLIGLAVPELGKRRLADVAERDVDRARVHVAVWIHPGGLPGVEARLDVGVRDVEESLADALLRGDRRLEGDVQLVLLSLGQRLLDLVVEDVDVDVAQVKGQDLVLLFRRGGERDEVLGRLLRPALREEHVLELERADDLVVLEPVQHLAEVLLVEGGDGAGDADRGGGLP